MKENKNSDIEGIKVLMVTETWLNEEKKPNSLKNWVLTFLCGREKTEKVGECL